MSKLLGIFCYCTGQFVSDLVGNLKDCFLALGLIEQIYSKYKAVTSINNFAYVRL